MHFSIHSALLSRGKEKSFMVKRVLSKKQITDLAKHVAEEAKRDKMPISKIFVFGSYAKNEANEDSDLDLCFISSKFKDIIEAEAYLRAKIYFILKQNIAVDVVAYRPEDFEETVPLVYEIRRHGKEIKW